MGVKSETPLPLPFISECNFRAGLLLPFFSAAKRRRRIGSVTLSAAETNPFCANMSMERGRRRRRRFFSRSPEFDGRSVEGKLQSRRRTETTTTTTTRTSGLCQCALMKQSTCSLLQSVSQSVLPSLLPRVVPDPDLPDQSRRSLRS